MTDADDYFGGEYLQDITERAHLQLGGQELRDAAHDPAGAYVGWRESCAGTAPLRQGH